jgi:hypothetical protein
MTVQRLLSSGAKPQVTEAEGTALEPQASGQRVWVSAREWGRVG